MQTESLLSGLLSRSLLDGLDLLGSSGLLGGRSSLLGLRRARLGDELHDNDGSVVALAVAELHDAGVTAVAVLPHALGSLVEDLGNELLIAELGDSQTTRVQVALLGPSDDRVDDRTQRLSAGLGGLDAVEIVAGIYLSAEPDRLIGLAEMFDYKKEQTR